MAVLKLSFDDLNNDEAFTLIAIHCILDNYRLAYLLNKHLKTAFVKDQSDVINIKLNTNYALFEYLDTNEEITYNLVENRCKVITKKVKTNATNLFSEEDHTNETTHYLIPEHKKAGYFLKIDTEFTNKRTQDFINKILEIPQVITAYYVNAENLKSKNNLIFY